MRVAIDARVPDALWGGVQQVVVGLASGLGRLDDGDEFVFVAYEGASAWLEPHLVGPCTLVEVPRSVGRTFRRRVYDRLASFAPKAAKVVEGAAPLFGRLSTSVPRSDGTVEALGVDLVHFTTQQAFVTDLPSIYQPHDLQHAHFPEFFSPLQARYRDTAYRLFSHQARIVSVMTEWGRRDLCSRYGVPVENVAVVPWAPVASLSTAVAPLAPLGRALPEKFLLYPAQTWQHKNHVRLVEAIGLLRDRGIDVDLVSTGRATDHMDVVQQRVQALGLAERVHFLGYVSADELAGLFRRATALVFPSLFEGYGLPIVEAFAFGLPVASSNATVLPEVTGDAALLFDPTDTSAIADAIARIWTDDALRSSLTARGRLRAASLSWNHTARTFRALYRLVANRGLTDEDRSLLAPPTLVQ